MRDRERYEQRVGTVVDGRWRVEALLGWGATSAVYAATHRNGHRAALKILHRSLCSDASVIARFLSETAAANTIRHRAIVPVNDDGTTEDGCTYLMLDLLEGETLEELRAKKSGRLDLEDVGPIAEELMSALAAVHAAGVVHRDLKPSNVLVTPQGAVKLLDFGTGRLVKGAPAFVSPEQAQGLESEIDAQSDVWALGATLFTLLCGEYVHPGRDARARLQAAATLPARKLGDVAPSLDERVTLVIDRALFQEKGERWRDVQSMRIAFRTAVMTAVPTMRDLAVFARVMDAEDETTAGAVPFAAPSAVADEAAPASLPPSERGGIATPMALASRIPPPRVSLRPLDRESDFELGVASTRRDVKPLSKGIHPFALLTGGAAMAAVVLLVVFFKSGGDASTGHVGAASESEGPAGKTDTTSSKVATSASAGFIVIEAPDDPAAIAAAKKKSDLPAWATAPLPKKADAGVTVAADAAAPLSSTSADAGAVSAAPAPTPEPVAPVVPAAPAPPPAAEEPE